MTMDCDDYSVIDPYIPEWRVCKTPIEPCEHFRLYVKDDTRKWQHVASLGRPDSDPYFRLWFEQGMEDSHEAWEVTSSIVYQLGYLPMQQLLEIQKHHSAMPSINTEKWLKGIWASLVGYCNSAGVYYSDVLWRHRL